MLSKMVVYSRGYGDLEQNILRVYTVDLVNIVTD